MARDMSKFMEQAKPKIIDTIISESERDDRRTILQ